MNMATTNTILNSKNSSKPWIRDKLHPISPTTAHQIEAKLNTEHDVIYYIFNYENKHSYIGQTKDTRGWKARIQTELRDARNAAAKGHIRDHVKRKVDQYMAEHRWFKWMVIPIHLFQENSTLELRTQVEEDYRRRLNATLNTKHLNIHIKELRKKKFKTPQKNHHRKTRQPKPNKYNKYTNLKQSKAKFMIHEHNKSSPITCINTYLKTQPNKTRVELRKLDGHHRRNQTDYIKLALFHGTSRVKIESVNTEPYWTTLGKAIPMLKDWRHRHIFHIEIKRRRIHEEKMTQLITSLSRNRNGGRKLLILAPLEHLLNILCHAKYEKLPPQTYTRVKNNLRGYLEKFKGFYTWFQPTVRYLHTNTVNKKEIRRYLTLIINSTPRIGDALKKHMSQTIRVIPENRKSIKQILMNYKRAAESWDIETGPTCIGPPWCKDNEHFGKPLEDIENLKINIGNINADMIPTPTPDETNANVLTNINYFLKDLANFANDNIGDTRKETDIKPHTGKLKTENLSLIKKEIIESLMKLDIACPSEMFNGINFATKAKAKKTPNPIIQTQNEILNTITTTNIRKIKKQLEGLIISERDKNTKNLYVECPVNHHKRIHRSLLSLHNYTYSCSYEKNQDMIIQEIRTRYECNELDHIAPWNPNCTLPQNFISPKEKDLKNKERVITSYAKAPLALVYKRTQKVLQWLFRNLPNEYRHFTLHKLNNIKDRVVEAKTKLNSIYGTDTRILPLATDVTKMYTDLTHDGIRKALRWLIEIMKNTTQTNKDTSRIRAPRSQNKNYVTLNCETLICEWGRGTQYGSRKCKGNSRDIITIHLDDIMKVVNIDLNYAYSEISNIIPHQIIGCPMGGQLSGLYANVYCAYDEHNFLSSDIFKNTTPDILQGIRQMDDLVAWIAYSPNDKASIKRAHEISETICNKSTMESKVYTGGLILKPEPIKYYNTGNNFVHDFAGSKIYGNIQCDELFCTTLNKNIQHITTHGEQKIARYPHADSYIPNDMKIAIHINTLHRLKTQNTRTRDLITAIYEHYEEMYKIGYSTKFIKTAANKLQKTSKEWPRIIDHLKRHNIPTYQST
jgi:hypothetical protein